MTIALRQRPLARIVAGIVRAADGEIFDASDMSTMFQDAVGTIPVTAVEQPVGLWLGKARGMMLGPEIVPDPTFSQWTNPSVPDGWSKSDTHNATNFVQQAAGGGIRLVSDGALISISKPNALEVGKFYKITFIVTSAVNPSVSTNIDMLETARASSVGTFNFIIKANNLTTLNFKRYGPDAACDMTVSYLSVRELYGYHATQSITASRPTLSARYNLLTKTEDFSDAAWTKQVAGTASAPLVTNNYGLAPDGTVTAARLQMALNGGTTTTDRSCLLQGPPMVSGTTYTSTFWVKSNTAQSYAVQQRLGLSAQNITIDQTWRAYTYSQTAASDNTHWLALRGAQGTSDSADILIWHPQLIIGATPGQYQRVNTATDYDTDERYFPKFLRFDGIDDYLVLPYMGLYANGSASLVAALTMTNANPQRLVHEANTGNSTPWYGLFRNAGGLCGLGALDDTGAVFVSNAASFGDTSKVKVISEIDFGANATTFINSISVDSDNYSRGGKTVTLNNTTIGASVSTTTTGYINANLYGLIITKSALTDSQRVACERYLGRKSGVQL